MIIKTIQLSITNNIQRYLFDQWMGTYQAPTIQEGVDQVIMAIKT